MTAQHTNNVHFACPDSSAATGEDQCIRFYGLLWKTSGDLSFNFTGQVSSHV